jgi:hypothetical protein
MQLRVEVVCDIRSGRLWNGGSMPDTAVIED